MDNTVHGLREFFTDPRRAGAVRVGGGAFCIVLLAALVWIALAQGGTRLDRPMGQALAGSAMAALATALGALPALFMRRISARWEAILLGFGAGVWWPPHAFR